MKRIFPHFMITLVSLGQMVSCGKPLTDSSTSGTQDFTTVLVALNPTLLKPSTAQSAKIARDALCFINQGERLLLQTAPAMVQSEDGPHFKIVLAPEVILQSPCRMDQGYVFAQHFRQEYVQKQSSPSPTISPAQQAENQNTPAATSSGKLGLFIWPVQSGAVTSGFGPRYNVMHEGIDIAVPSGTSVLAAASGQVLFAGWSTIGYGNLMQISHAENFETRYGHNSNLVGMTVGKVVVQGDEIAKSGSSGNSTGPHVHFEIRMRGTAHDPARYLPSRGGKP